MKKFQFWYSLAAASVLLSPTALRAQNLLVSTGLGGYQTNQYNAALFSDMKSYLVGALPSTTTTGLLNNSGFALGFDRLWVDQRLQAPLSAAEITTISNFAATGRRMVLIGENSSWNDWNSQLAGIVGGTLAGPDCQNNNLTTAVSNALTAGVTTVNEACGYGMNGGLSLFAGRGLATLWGANQNVLVWLDSNMQDNAHLDTVDNRKFAQNVATWLAGGSVQTVAPEPATNVLLAFGMVAVGFAARRRVKAGR
ncbi:MAG: PEP-CTERM sorting domain-containing protein [Gemmatimonas sp.]